MAGYLEPIGKQPTALSYPPSKEHTDPRVGAPYFYFTRRPYELEDNERHSLVCAGGPEEVIEDSSSYVRDREYPVEAQKEIDEFLRETYIGAPKEITFKFSWHGLMGYTPNRIRVVGREPRNPSLLYNLGCNGIGILPSIAGGQRIAKILRGDALPPSIFDPRNQQ
jgi:glycine/D-amino acid oxidase-like deaminating enzyme